MLDNPGGSSVACDIMRCFTGKVEEVKNTRIFARLRTDGRQVLIYQMSVDAPQDLAMVLPIPIKVGSGEDAVKFYDFSNYEAVFEDLAALWPPSVGINPSAIPRAAKSYSLKVISVGAYDASFVPTIADFSRLDTRFRLPEGVWAKLPGYADYGFAVFKLRQGKTQVHPMAFSFLTALTKTVYFPTLHIHDGKVHAKENFDHKLYLQGSSLNINGWAESFTPAEATVKCNLTHGMIRPDLHVYSQSMHGKYNNGDVVVKVRAA